MKYARYIKNIIANSFYFTLSMILTCNLSFGANVPSCKTAKIGCWTEGVAKGVMTPVESITIQQTLVKEGTAYFCKIRHTPEELKELCKQANPGRKKVKVQVPEQACFLMPGNWSMNGYYAHNLQVCFIPIHE